jgi:3-oxoacyl-[acyl-carrier-protein] synthase II
MTRRVLITGLGPISGLGQGIDPTWQQLLAGHGAVAPIREFDASKFACRVAAQIDGFNVNQYVPKTYRKAVKVMARDIALAVAAAELAARDAGLVTRGNAAEGASTSYDPTRMGVHIGAGLIAAELDELTAALAEARDERGGFDYHKWGREGMTHLTPLWLLKYLPNMLACHVTIIHDAQGPSNTITCGESSALLSVGESLRVIQRGAADLCFCGGAESKLNPMAYLRQHMTGWLNPHGNDRPATAVRPFCQTAAGTAIGEGGGIVILESLDTFRRRAANGSAKAYAEVLGFGASQTLNPAVRNLMPDPQGRGLAAAIRAALRDAAVTPAQIDLVIPFGVGVPACDHAEAAALRAVFGSGEGGDGDGGARQPVVASIKSMVGLCGAGVGGLDVCAAAKALAEQTVPAVINCEQPLDGIRAGASGPRRQPLEHVLIVNTGMGGQNAAMVLKRFQA